MMQRGAAGMLFAVVLVSGGGCGETTALPAICASDEDCLHTGAPVCNPSSGECVECMDEGDCEPGLVCVDFACVPDEGEEACSIHEDCTAFGLELCDPDERECVECLESTDCGAGQVCRAGSCEDFEPWEGWRAVDLPAEEDLRSVACSEGRVWAAGNAGTLLHSKGGLDFYAQDTSSVVDFASVAFVDALQGVVVGGASILETRDGGESWSPAWFCPAIAMSEYTKIVMVSEDTGYAVGQSRNDEGTFKYRIPQGWNCFTGQTWPDYTLLTAAYTASTRGFMTGDTGGHVLKTEDMFTWETIDSGFPYVFFDMAFLDARTGWIVGEGGLVLRTDDGGESWRRLAEGVTSQDLRAVAVGDEDVVIAVGASGTVIESLDGGETFTVTRGGGERGLNDVCFLGTTAYAVGEGGLMIEALTP